MAKARFEPGLTKESTRENAPVLTDGKNPRRDGALNQQDGFGKMQWPPLNRRRRRPRCIHRSDASGGNGQEDDEGNVRNIEAYRSAHFVMVLVDVGAGARLGFCICIGVRSRSIAIGYDLLG